LQIRKVHVRASAANTAGHDRWALDHPGEAADVLNSASGAWYGQSVHAAGDMLHSHVAQTPPTQQTVIKPAAAAAAVASVQAKIYAVGWVLWAAGKTKEANLLKTAFKAFNVYNSRRYDRKF
jgi:hypothetical protein